jgi:hypothetical protein
MNTWLDPNFRYLGSTTHADARAFRRRQRERLRQAIAAAAERRQKVQPIGALKQQAKA